MRVMRHQAPRKNFQIQLLCHEIEIGPPIAVSLENGNGSYAPLRDVMRIPGGYDSGDTRHA